MTTTLRSPVADTVCWTDAAKCCPPRAFMCDREGDFCYREYRQMSAGCIAMHYRPADDTRDTCFCPSCEGATSHEVEPASMIGSHP